MILDFTLNPTLGKRIRKPNGRVERVDRVEIQKYRKRWFKFFKNLLKIVFLHALHVLHGYTSSLLFLLLIPFQGLAPSTCLYPHTRGCLL